MGTSIQVVEKKMEMSLDEIIKQNKARSAAGKPKQGAKPALQKGKGAPSQKKPAGKATAAGGSKLINKNLAATGGVKKAGASAKRTGVPTAGGRGQSLAKKIVARSLNKKTQPALKPALKAAAKGGQGPKQMSVKKPKQKIVFAGAKPQQQQQQQRQALQNKALTKNQKRRLQRKLAKQANAGAMQVDVPAVQGGVRKRRGGQARVPIFQNQQPMQQRQGGQRGQAPQGRRGGRGFQPQQVVVQQRRAPVMQQQVRRPAPAFAQRGYGGGQGFAPRGGPQTGVSQRQQAAIQALRLQQLEEERIRAERRAFIHRQMQMLEPVHRGGGGGGGGPRGRAPMQPVARGPPPIRAGGYGRSGYY